MLASDDWSFVAEPIDGTAAYAAGLTSWVVMIAASRSGWPVMSELHLPMWTRPQLPKPAKPTGLIVAAMNGDLLWATSAGGRMQGALRRFVAPRRRERPCRMAGRSLAPLHAGLHEGRVAAPVQRKLAADAVSLVLGQLEATTFNFSLWDLVPTLPILEAARFGLHRRPNLAAPSRANVAELLRDDFALASELLLICRSRATAERLASAIRPAPLEPVTSAAVASA